MNLEQGINHILDGNAVLFAGAGFSRGATNRRDHEFKIGDELAKHLAALSGAPADAALEDASEAFQRKFGASGLIDELTKEFCGKTVTPFQVAFASLPWMRIYTTNYDDVIETSAKRVGVSIQPVTSDADPFSLDPKSLTCVHLNGYIHKLSPAELDNTFKLTETSYVTAAIVDSPWAFKLREDIRTAKAVFIAGYSLFDIDVRRILTASPLLRDKCFFIVGKDPKQTLLQRIDRYGVAVSETVSDFSQRIELLKASYKPTKKPSLDFQSLEERQNLPAPKIPSDQLLFDLFELGAIDSAGVSASLIQGIRYYLERSKTASVLKLIEAGSKIVAVTGGLGNGKTLLLHSIAARAREHGYRVFSPTTPCAESSLEFERLARSPEKILLLVDDYQRWITQIGAFRQVKNESARVVVTARDAIHDVLYGRLEDVSGVDSVPEISIDKLSDSEIEWLTDTLEQYGLWRSMSGRTRDERRQIISYNYKSEFHSVLLGLLTSQDIGSRVEKVLVGVKHDPAYFDVVSTVFIFAIIGTPATLEMLGDLWGADLISSTRFRDNEHVRQLIDFSSSSAIVRSSVVAEYVLKKCAGPEIVSVAIKLTHQLSKAASGSISYRHTLIESARFSNLQRIFPEANFRELAIRYFEGVKTVPQFQQNSLFWLQYAIACFVEGDLSRAKKYFEVAYSHAGKGYSQTNQIDNHYARFLLQETLDANLSIEMAIGNFRKARSIINMQMQKERIRYPYKTATSYQNFVDRFGKHFNEGMAQEVQAAAEHALERAKELPEHIRSQLQVRNCEAAMRYVIERCGQLVAAWRIANATPGQIPHKISSPPAPPPLHRTKDKRSE